MKSKSRTPKFESPNVTYVIPADKLVVLLQKYGIEGRRTFEKIFTDLIPYEDPSILEKISNHDGDDEEKTTTLPTKTKEVDALFFIPKSKNDKARYKYLKLKLAPSAIKKAGTGVYAIDPIPKNARGPYKGVAREDGYINPYYSWTVKSFDTESGDPDDDDEALYYVDAYDIKKSNWTRFVNCGMKNKDNNFESEQKFDKFYYVATKNIKEGEELFIDYGEEYRTDNLGMKGKY